MQESNISSVAVGHPAVAARAGERRQDAVVGRIAGFLFGVVAYLTFFGTILYAIGFVTGLVVPKAIDDGPMVPTIEALMVNLALMSLFAVQHSVMARKPFKRWLTQYIPAAIERRRDCIARSPAPLRCSTTPVRPIRIARKISSEKVRIMTAS